MIRVFLDANVYFAGFFSSKGASSLIFESVSKKKLMVFASRLVLREADKNLRLKGDAKSVKAFHRFLQKTKIRVIPTPDERVLQRYESVIHPKDVPVLAAALESKVAYLITLDQRHFLTEKVQSYASKEKFKVMTPGDFLREAMHRR